MSRARHWCATLPLTAPFPCRFDGLNAELAKTPNNTASVAFAHDSELIADDVSVYAHIHLWLGTFFEHVRSEKHTSCELSVSLSCACCFAGLLCGGPRPSGEHSPKLILGTILF